ncbi:hypothetical protein T261_8210 [Streptomyces lydicus]|nr:hypothetical protein T261_8210 [Streptomyces lydicus]
MPAQFRPVEQVRTSRGGNRAGIVIDQGILNSPVPSSA